MANSTFAKFVLVILLAMVMTACNSISPEDDALRNMRGITNCAILNVEDNNGQFPEHLAQLVTEGLHPKLLVDPRLGHTPMAVPTEKDWHKIAADVDAHCDFYYAGQGVTSSTSPLVIVLYDKGGTMRLVGFSDTHVMKYPAGSPELKAAIATSNAANTTGRAKLPENLDGPPVK